MTSCSGMLFLCISVIAILVFVVLVFFVPYHYVLRIVLVLISLVCFVIAEVGEDSGTGFGVF